MKPEWIARQSSWPRGWLGEIVARVMSFETIRVNRIALELLEVGAGESVLEVGCGTGEADQVVLDIARTVAGQGYVDVGNSIGIDSQGDRCRAGVTMTVGCRRSDGMYTHREDGWKRAAGTEGAIQIRDPAKR